MTWLPRPVSLVGDDYELCGLDYQQDWLARWASAVAWCLCAPSSSMGLKETHSLGLRWKVSTPRVEVPRYAWRIEVPHYTTATLL